MYFCTIFLVYIYLFYTYFSCNLSLHYLYTTIATIAPWLPLAAIHAEHYCFIVLPTERVMNIETMHYRIYIVSFIAFGKNICTCITCLVYICLFRKSYLFTLCSLSLYIKFPNTIIITSLLSFLSTYVYLTKSYMFYLARFIILPSNSFTQL